jgi:hypothetical protein
MNPNEIERGWDVFAADGDKVGDVWEARGDYIVVSKGFLFKSDHYVPMSAISGLERGRVHLNVAKDQMDAQGWEREPDERAGKQPIKAGDAWGAEARQPTDRPVEQTETVTARAGGSTQGGSMRDEDQRIPTTADVSSRGEKPTADQSGEPAKAETREGQEARPADMAALFSREGAEDFRSRWSQIQTGFVDEPRRAVEQADALVAEVIKRLAENFADERSKLEAQWGRGGDVNTEDLRVALQRYRSFFDRLLSM